MEAKEVKAVVADVMEDVSVMVVGVKARMTRNRRTKPSMVSISVISGKDSAQLTGNVLVVMVGNTCPEFFRRM